MTDPARPAGEGGKAGSPFPAAYGSLGAGQPDDAEAAEPSPRVASKRPEERATLASKLSQRGEAQLRRRRRAQPSGSGPVPAVARSGSAPGPTSAAPPVTPTSTPELTDAAGARIVVDSNTAPSRAATKTPARPRPAPAPGPSSAPSPSGPEAPTRISLPARTLPDDATARQVGREYAPEADIAVGRQRWWQRRRRVTVVRSRSTRRLVRRLDTWTVFKVSLIFYLLGLIIILVAGVVTWHVAGQVGFITDIQKAVRSLADDTKFKLHGGVVFKYTLVGGAVLAVAGTLLNVIAAMLYNLISDVIGGVQVIVISEPD